MNDQLDIFYLDKVLGGDKEAFRYFIKEYQQMAYSIALSILKDKHHTEDVVQNAFIQAFRSLRSFKREAKWSSWFYKIVVNESLKFLNKNKKKAKILEHSLAQNSDSTTTNLAIDQIAFSEKKEKINKALTLMKPKEALVLKLHYLHELALNEIVEITGFSLSNVKVLLHRARKNFIPFYTKE